MRAIYEYPDAQATTVSPFTEEELAAFLADRGSRIFRSSSGRYWKQARRGFWVGTHWLCRFTLAQIRDRPLTSWGCRVALVDEDVARANAAIPLYLVRDATQYDEKSLSPRMARYVRAFRKQGIQIVRLTDMRMIEDQGYAVYESWCARIRCDATRLKTRQDYLEQMRRQIRSASWVVLAGIRDDVLLGYMASWSVNDSAYLEDLHVHSDAMDTHLSAALYFDSIRVFGASGKIREVCCGPDTPEAGDLYTFKLRVGFELVFLPSRVVLPPLARPLIRRMYPATYYRLVGVMPESLRLTRERSLGTTSK